MKRTPGVWMSAPFPLIAAAILLLACVPLWADTVPAYSAITGNHWTAKPIAVSPDGNFVAVATALGSEAAKFGLLALPDLKLVWPAEYREARYTNLLLRGTSAALGVPGKFRRALKRRDMDRALHNRIVPRFQRLIAPRPDPGL